MTTWMSRPVLRAALYGLTLALAIAAVGPQLPGLLLPRPALLSDLGLGPAGRSLVLPALRGDDTKTATASGRTGAPALTLPPARGATARRVPASGAPRPVRAATEPRPSTAARRPAPPARPPAGRRSAPVPVADLAPDPAPAAPAPPAPASPATGSSSTAPTTAAPRRMALRVARMALNRGAGPRAAPRLDLRLALEDAAGTAARAMDLSLDVTGLAEDARDLSDAPVALHGRIEVVNAAALVAGAAVDPQLRIRLQVEADAGEARAEVAATDDHAPEVLSNAVDVSLPFDPEALEGRCPDDTDPAPAPTPHPPAEAPAAETLEVLLPIGVAAPVAEQVAEVPATAAASEPATPEAAPEGAAITVAVRLEVVADDEPTAEAAPAAGAAAGPAPVAAP